MRLAYKVWSGVAAAVFCTVAVTDLSSAGSRPAGRRGGGQPCRGDRYGRMLRNVSVGGQDFASAMVREDHTAIYTRGRNDASPAVQATLRALDTDGRTCGTASTPTTTTTTTTTRPAPSTRTSTPSPDVDRPRTPRPAAGSGSSGGSPASGGSTYRNCAAARAAGAAPLHAGQPGYSTGLDRDRDGVACE